MLQCIYNANSLTQWKLCVPVWLLFNGVNEPVLDNDAELLRDIGAGDRSAFSRFYDQYSKLLFSIAFKILNDAREAEDVLQEVFLQVWTRPANTTRGWANR